MKVVWNVPRSTHTYLIDNYFTLGQNSLKKQILSRYPGFLRALQNSECKEVRFLYRIVSKDKKSVTCKNRTFLESSLRVRKIEQISSHIVRERLPVNQIPNMEKWRIPLLESIFTYLSFGILTIEEKMKSER